MIPPRISRGLRLLGLALPIAAALAPSLGTASASGTTDSNVIPHFMKSINASGPSGAPPAGPSNPLIYQTANAPVETTAQVYLIFWGVQWQVGWSDVSFTGQVYSSGQAQTYITDFFKYVSASATAWNGTTTQYCQGTAQGSTSCSGGTHITNPPVFGGSWVDTTSPPPPTLLPDSCVVIVCATGGIADTANLLAQEALRAEQHFGYNANADYMIFLPEATLTLGADAVYCAYHSEVTDSSNRKISYTNMPYINTANVGCGQNFVNTTDNSYGNGFFDGYSIVAGHEFGEAETDPLPSSKAAWRDASGAENGDKCAWVQPGTAGGAHNIGPDANGHSFAVQTLWSNSAGGCAG